MPPRAGRKKSLLAIANERVSFTRACELAGIKVGMRDRGMKTTCPGCGQASALRVFTDHGYCFAEQKRYSAVQLLAEHWNMDFEHAAIRALNAVGYVPLSWAHRWEEAQADPPPALDALATALRTWCEANSPDWRHQKYDPQVSNRLAQCIGALRKVRTEEDCSKWLETCKVVMGRVLSGDLAKPLDSG